MKLSQLLPLNEGLVKIPDSTFNSALEFVVSVYFSQLKATYLENDRQPPLEFKRALKRATAKYGNVSLYDISTTQRLQIKVPYPVKDLPANYKKGLSRDFVMRIIAGSENSDDLAYYTHKKKGRSGRVVINIDKLVDLRYAMDNIDQIDSQLHIIAATVEHELMHATQDVALKGTPSSVHAINYYDKNNKVDFHKYSLSPVEFSPNIKTAAGEFKSEVASINDGEVLRKHVEDYFHAFVNPTLTSPFHDAPSANPVFAVLYKESKPKWKKAVKYLHGLLSDYINSFSPQ